jgi:hypothetical protein
MKRTLLAICLTLMLSGTTAFAGTTALDTDGDGVLDNNDNCSLKINPAQDDTDGDDCGNLCDADYNQTGTITFGDFGQFSIVFGLTGHPLQQHVEPISAANVVNFADFGYFASVFGTGLPPGPSGTTAGTTACP